MKRMVSLTLSLALSLFLAACVTLAPADGATAAGAAGDGNGASAGATATEVAEASTDEDTSAGREVERAAFPLFFGDERMDGEQTLYFLDGVRDLPYIDAHDWLELMRLLYEVPGFPVDFKMSAEGPVVTYSRHSDRYDGDVTMAYDFDSDIVTVSDYNLFVMKPGQSTVLDLIGMDTYDNAGAPILLEKVDTGTMDRLGDALEIDLGSYGIDLVRQDGLYLIPLQTVADLIASPVWLESIYFNGQSVIVSENATSLGDLYYAAPTGERSAELAAYGYGELCMLLDNAYGLKEDHGIESFDKFFREVGFRDVLLGDSVRDADKAILRTITDYMDDVHSNWYGYSYLSGPIDYTATSPSRARLAEHRERMMRAREARYPKGVPGYEEVGNTAYVTFDEFALTMASAEEFYEVDDPMDFSDDDTIGLIMKAHAQITRKGSPIENVVIDLSNNVGGVSDTAVFAMAWFLGEASIGMRDTMTGATCSSVYRCDANRDRRFDDADTVSDKNLFCLISPVSFSCGNLVPCMFKESGRVTLLGRPSAGGACIVENASTAWGTAFRISSSHQLSFAKNGSLYDIDRGTEPDFVLAKPASFYDRVALTARINAID